MRIKWILLVVLVVVLQYANLKGFMFSEYFSWPPIWMVYAIGVLAIIFAFTPLPWRWQKKLERKARFRVPSAEVRSLPEEVGRLIEERSPSKWNDNE